MLSFLFFPPPRAMCVALPVCVRVCEPRGQAEWQRDWPRWQAIGRQDSTALRQRNNRSQAAIRPRAAGEGSSGISRLQVAAAVVGWKLCRCCDTHRASRGAPIYGRDKEGIFTTVPVGISGWLPGTKALCYPLSMAL